MTMMPMPVMAAAYNFGGADPGNFAQPTSVEPETVIGGPADESSNIDRSKDSASTPPPFGSPSSDTTVTIIFNQGNNSGSPAAANNGSSGGTEYYPVSFVDPDTPPQMDVSYSSYSSNKFTLPDGMYYSDGSIGTLSIPKLNVNNIKVYDEESLENLKKGIGHFKSISCWGGNVGFAAHNRGTIGYFGKIHTLKNGDKIEYRTIYGLRVYEVYYVGQIKETDFSRLNRTENNIITLTTCVNDTPELRWCVQAREVR
jgi:sortase A